jgi:hypothetical protein
MYKETIKTVFIVLGLYAIFILFGFLLNVSSNEGDGLGLIFFFGILGGILLSFIGVYMLFLKAYKHIGIGLLIGGMIVSIIGFNIL